MLDAAINGWLRSPVSSRRQREWLITAEERPQPWYGRREPCVKRGGKCASGGRYDQVGQVCYAGASMRAVNIADLKAKLSAHIRLVRQGEELLVCDRNKPVARIVPYRPEDYSEQEQRLMVRGILIPPLKRRAPSVSWPTPPGNVPDDIAEQAWHEERQGR